MVAKFGEASVFNALVLNNIVLIARSISTGGRLSTIYLIRGPKHNGIPVVV